MNVETETEVGRGRGESESERQTEREGFSAEGEQQAGVRRKAEGARCLPALPGVRR